MDSFAASASGLRARGAGPSVPASSRDSGGRDLGPLPVDVYPPRGAGSREDNAERFWEDLEEHAWATVRKTVGSNPSRRARVLGLLGLLGEALELGKDFGGPEAAVATGVFDPGASPPPARRRSRPSDRPGRRSPREGDQRPEASRRGSAQNGRPGRFSCARAGLTADLGVEAGGREAAPPPGRTRR